MPVGGELAVALQVRTTLFTPNVVVFQRPKTAVAEGGGIAGGKSYGNDAACFIANLSLCKAAV